MRLPPESSLKSCVENDYGLPLIDIFLKAEVKIYGVTEDEVNLEFLKAQSQHDEDALRSLYIHSAYRDHKTKKLSFSRRWKKLPSRRKSSQDGQGHSCALERDSGTADPSIVPDVTPSDVTIPDLTMLQKFALNALNLSVPASSILLNNYRSGWVQISGHPGSLAPAGPGTIWKKRTDDPTETKAYECLMKDPAKAIVPTFFRELKYNNEYFIEMEDLLFNFNDPCVMDIKMGTRTFLESEVSNRKARPDLYQKMIKLDPEATTAEEEKEKAVTKLRYMDFRDTMSSSRELGFRVEAMKMCNSPDVKELRTVRTRSEILVNLSDFLCGRECTKRQVLRRLQQIRSIFESSPFFRSHEVIGSSVLIVYDDTKAGVWLIDFAKTHPIPEDVSATHRRPWKFGNHEEGYLTGLDNLIKVIESVPVAKQRRLPFFSK